MTAVTFPLRLPRLAFAICGWRWQNDMHEIKYSVCLVDTMLPMLADYLGMKWLLLIYPLYIWITGSKFTCDRPRKQGRTEQVAIIYTASDPKGNDANTLSSRG